MRLKFKENHVTVKPTDEEYFTSPFTGHQLKRFQVAVSVREQQLFVFEDELDYVKVHCITEVDEDGKEIGKYNISNTSYSYSDNSDGRMYSFELSEAEKIKIHKLLIEDIELTPYEYEETLSDEAIIIHTKVTVTKDIADRIEGFHENEEKYFTVIREGINENPIKMRFGVNIWSEHENDVIKYRLVIVEDKYDAEDDVRRPLNYPVTQNIQSMTLYHKSYIELLANLLVDKGLLSKEEIERLKDKAKEENSKNERYIYQVKDVDQESL
ncbi:hypothetical protein V6B33_16415 [Mangrovibacillus sp. Mu-81]|jgi:hypothetical protein|uniref:hypothetical protein n=1 Tax=Bacillaceae TaxID=186817 RepID=UPI002494BAA4|nr:hypothetical protein [Rossellomorea aquimaris]